MDAQARDIMIPSIFASALLILTAMQRAEITIAMSIVIFCSLLLLRSSIDQGALWPKILFALAAGGIASAVVIFMLR